MKAIGRMTITTLMLLTMNDESQAARDTALASPMEQVMEAGYERLDGILAASHAA